MKAKEATAYVKDVDKALEELKTLRKRMPTPQQLKNSLSKCETFEDTFDVFTRFVGCYYDELDYGWGDEE